MTLHGTVGPLKLLAIIDQFSKVWGSGGLMFLVLLELGIQYLWKQLIQLSFTQRLDTLKTMF